MDNFYQNQNNGGVLNGGTQMQNSLPFQEQSFQGNQQGQKTAVQSLQSNKRKSASRPNQVTPEMKKTYEAIFNSYGEDAANEWLKEQIVNNHVGLQNDNEVVIREIKEKYAELTSLPAVQKAIDAYIQMDLDPSTSLRDQGFHDVMEHIANIYRAGYEDAMNLKNQNNSAKARMSSAINSAVPDYQNNRAFTRSDIRKMSPDEFKQNEKAIFEQLGRGLIK